MIYFVAGVPLPRGSEHPSSPTSPLGHPLAHTSLFPKWRRIRIRGALRVSSGIKRIKGDSSFTPLILILIPTTHTHTQNSRRGSFYLPMYIRPSSPLSPPERYICIFVNLYLRQAKRPFHLNELSRRDTLFHSLAYYIEHTW